METGDIIKYEEKNYILESIIPIGDEKSMLIFSETNLTPIRLRREEQVNANEITILQLSTRLDRLVGQVETIVELLSK